MRVMELQRSFVCLECTVAVLTCFATQSEMLPPAAAEGARRWAQMGDATLKAAGFKPPSDPAEPEPAVHVPKPVPPCGPLSSAELHEVAVHAADSMDVPRYVGRYFEARRQVGRLLDAPLA